MGISLALKKREMAPGGYEVMVESPCHEATGERVKIQQGKERVVTVEPKERQGAVKVKARDSKGNDIEGAVFVDGVKVGTTPDTFKVSICARELQVRNQKLGATFDCRIQFSSFSNAEASCS